MIPGILRGFYYPATVLADCKPGMPAHDDELFGPVAAIIRAKDDEDAMRIANSSRYGLGGGIFTKDEEKAVRNGPRPVSNHPVMVGIKFLVGAADLEPVPLRRGGRENSGDKHGRARTRGAYAGM